MRSGSFSLIRSGTNVPEAASEDAPGPTPIPDEPSPGEHVPSEPVPSEPVPFDVFEPREADEPSEVVELRDPRVSSSEASIRNWVPQWQTTCRPSCESAIR